MELRVKKLQKPGKHENKGVEAGRSGPGPDVRKPPWSRCLYRRGPGAISERARSETTVPTYCKLPPAGSAGLCAVLVVAAAAVVVVRGGGGGVAESNREVKKGCCCRVLLQAKIQRSTRCCCRVLCWCSAAKTQRCACRGCCCRVLMQAKVRVAQVLLQGAAAGCRCHLLLHANAAQAETQSCAAQGCRGRAGCCCRAPGSSALQQRPVESESWPLVAPAGSFGP